MQYYVKHNALTIRHLMNAHTHTYTHIHTHTHIYTYTHTCIAVRIMSEAKRRHSNKLAQRKFRQKQAEQAQQAKEEFDDLKFKYEAVLAENESLKQITHDQRSRSRHMSVVSLVDEWTSVPTEPSQFADFDLERELFLFPDLDNHLYPLVASGSDESTELAMQDIALPSIELAHSNSHTSAETEYLGREGCPLSLPDPVYSNGPSQLGIANGFAYPEPRVDVVQAIVQIVLAQERIAFIDLEKAKLQVGTITRRN